jgi:hypothetical protein
MASAEGTRFCGDLFDWALDPGSRLEEMFRYLISYDYGRCEKAFAERSREVPLTARGRTFLTLTRSAARVVKGDATGAWKDLSSIIADETVL